MKDYGPALDWWKMIPFFQMDQAKAFGDNHPDLRAITKKDQDAALAGLPRSLQP
ncbi:MAG TPA: hypothetical protein VHY48_00465 [Acidobacteriaceae bacterium]|jgi:hypothetical protein|nr:hypothetical protein [Acidobacteriaceae bacterium]